MGKRGGIRVIDPGSRRSSMLSLGVPDLESAKGRVGMAQADLRTALPADAGAAIAAVQERIPDGRVTLDSIHLVRRHGPVRQAPCCREPVQRRGGGISAGVRASRSGSESSSLASLSTCRVHRMQGIPRASSTSGRSKAIPHSEVSEPSGIHAAACTTRAVSRTTPARNRTLSISTPLQPSVGSFHDDGLAPVAVADPGTFASCLLLLVGRVVVE